MGKSQCDGASDTGTRAGDDHTLAIEFAHAPRPLSFDRRSAHTRSHSNIFDHNYTFLNMTSLYFG
jgi:hypothetical protein